MSSAWIYCENNTRDRQQRDIRCRSICQHHWGPLTGHSVAPLHALRVAATAVWAPAPSFRARGRETARRREEAPSRASPVSNQKKTEGRTPTAVKGRPKNARHRANCFRPTKATLQPGSRRRAGLSRDVAFHCKLSDHEPIISRKKPSNPSLDAVRAWALGHRRFWGAAGRSLTQNHPIPLNTL